MNQSAKQAEKGFTKKSFLIAAFGTMLEYYDFSLFVTFLPIIAPVFFPANSIEQSFVKGYLILLISTLGRPLGALFFGYYGDFFGRSKTLLWSMLGIALATLVIGLTPSYATFGFGTTVLILAAKLIQAFCFGGEYNGAGIYVVEHAAEKSELLTGSLLSLTALLGGLLASLLGVLLSLQFIPAGSFRLAFIIGGALGLIALFFRRDLIEPSVFREAEKEDSLFKLLRCFPLEMLTGAFIGGMTTVLFSTVVIFLNPMLMAKGYLTSHQIMLLQLVLYLTGVITLLAFSFLFRKKSALGVLQLGCCFIALITFPLLYLFDQGQLGWMLTALIILLMSTEICFAPSNAYLKNLFPMKYRYRGTSFSFCIGMAVFGGLTPLVDNFLYQSTGKFSSLALWIGFIYFTTFLLTRKLQQRAGKVEARQSSAVIVQGSL